MVPPEPLTARLSERRAALAEARRRERIAATAALAALAATLATVALAWDGRLSWWALAPVGLALVALIVLRERRTRARRRLGHAVVWLERAEARLQDRWSFGQPSGAEYVDPTHPYASDLDLFGEASLFERLNDCPTSLGRDRLAWLLRGAPGSGVARAGAIRRLRDDVDFREELAVELAELAMRSGRSEAEREQVDAGTRALPLWGEEPAAPPEGAGSSVARWALALAACGALAGKLALGWPLGVVALLWAVNLVWLSVAGRDVGGLLSRFEAVRGTLDAWSRVFEVLERRGGIEALRAAAASPAIRRLRVLVDRLSWRRNWVWHYSFGVFLLWDLHVRRALDGWRRAHGPRLRGWFDAAAAMEADAALAAYAAGVPEAAWAEPAEGEAVLEAEAVAHPLLPRATRVGNDVALGGRGSVLLVTGSNMSGKSTFLRSVGLAMVMARVGLPVTARRARLSEAEVWTCMRTQDSLARGSSRFHAEVMRLKACVDGAARAPLSVVLLDELLSGTNSRERHAGAHAVLRMVARLPAVTLLSTHDLELVALERELPGRVRTVHFRDQLTDGVMTFDYVMRPGPLPTTNALRVLKAAGLEVEDEKGSGPFSAAGKGS
jgi:hypothetical protein